MQKSEVEVIQIHVQAGLRLLPTGFGSHILVTNAHGVDAVTLVLREARGS